MMNFTKRFRRRFLTDCFEKKVFAAVTFYDLCIAFDCVSRNILLSVPRLALKAFETYLEGRTLFFVVMINVLA